MGHSSLQDILARSPIMARMGTTQADESPFAPRYRQCEKHGDYQANALDEQGMERWVAHCPKCTAEQRTRSLLDRAAIPLRFQDRELGSYLAETVGQNQALAVAREFALSFTDALRTGTCLTFVGKPGTGKTHLACGIALHVMRDGYTALFVTASELIRVVRSTWRRDAEKTEEQVLNEFAAVELLVIDEVGVQFGTEAEQVTLFEIINRRYSNARPMVLLSNLPVASDDPKQRTLRDYLGDRAYDRLREGGGKLVVFDWPSYRRNV